MLDKKDCADGAADDTLGGRISLAREAAGLGMAEAASRLGVQKVSWQAWECDRAAPRANRLTTMAGILRPATCSNPYTHGSPRGSIRPI